MAMYFEHLLYVYDIVLNFSQEVCWNVRVGMILFAIVVIHALDLNVVKLD